MNQENPTRHGSTGGEAGNKSGLHPYYEHRWAIVIGIDNYKHLEHLKYAVKDAQGVVEILRDQFGFDKFTELPDEKATRDAILDVLINQLPETSPNDCVLLYFAGHGARRRYQGGLEKGFLAPFDAVQNDWTTYIDVQALVNAANEAGAKHILYIVDSCYSGFATTRAANFQPTRFLREVLTRRARQVLTAGLDNQVVADLGADGHSLFTYYLLQGLKGEASLTGDGTVTATELMSYVKSAVGKNDQSRQTPDFGSLPGHQSGGDFVFLSQSTATAERDLTKVLEKLIGKNYVGQIFQIAEDPDEQKQQQLGEKIKAVIIEITMPLIDHHHPSEAQGAKSIQGEGVLGSAAYDLAMTIRRPSPIDFNVI